MTHEVTDFELAERAQSGDTRAFEQLLQRHYGMMFKVAYKWCGHKQDAQDIAQETCVKLASAIAQYRFDSAFTTWLYRVILNTGKDFMRARQTRQKYESDFVHEQQFDEAPHNQEEAMQARDAMRAINALPDKIRETVLLVACEGLSHAEAGKALECSEGTISWRIHEAKTLLKKAGGA
jgi:RNA polymerase sigma-70 factor (ECF subfamily)